MIGTLAELAALPGMPSEPTLRRLLKEHDDFAGIIRRGSGKGDAWEIDLPVAVDFYRGLEERDRIAREARQADLNQLGLALGVAPPAAPGFTIADRKALMEEEVVAIKLAEKRGELIDKAGVEAALAGLLIWLRQQQTSFAERLAKRADVSRALQIEIERLIVADQRAQAARIREIGAVLAPADGGGRGDSDGHPAAPALEAAAA